MTKRERVYATLAHQPTDKIVKGEINISGILANKILGSDYPLDYQHFERDLAVRQALNADLINVGDWPSKVVGKDAKGNTVYKSTYGYEYIAGVSNHVTKPPIEDIEDAEDYVKPDINEVNPAIIKRFVEETDLFVFAQIAGPISMLNEMFGMEDYMVYCMTNPDEIDSISAKVVEYEIEKAKLFIDNGAHAIFLADDMAFNSGTLLPPDVMDAIVFPYYKQMVKEIKAYKDVPIIIHTDGQIMDIMDRIVECGFDGIQSLQPSAGMDIKVIKEKYGDKLCLWGNIDLDYIMSFGTPDEVRQNVKETIDIAAKGSGFILSTCNTMVDVIPAENAIAMYQTAEEYDMQNV